MPFRFMWYDDEKTVMRYAAEGDWNWRDYHACARAATFSMHRHPHPVDVLIDLRGSTRLTMPSGLAAHTRTFGKRLTPALSGRAVVLGLPSEAEGALGLTPDRTITTDDGEIHFVDSEDAARQLFAMWRAADA